MKQIFLPLVDVWHLLFPDVCAICEFNGTLPKSQFCLQCEMDLPFTDHALIRENEFKLRFAGRLELEFAMALLYFSQKGKVQKAIHELKYKGDKSVGIYLGQLFAEKLCSMNLSNMPDILIPIPIHNARRDVRGYNQMEVIANSISDETGIPVNVKLLKKQYHQNSQTNKSRSERFSNVLESFSVKELKEIENKHILILDDVCTTGATLEAAASKILEKYNVKISFGIIALAQS